MKLRCTLNEMPLHVQLHQCQNPHDNDFLIPIQLKYVHASCQQWRVCPVEINVERKSKECHSHSTKPNRGHMAFLLAAHQ